MAKRLSPTNANKIFKGVLDSKIYKTPQRIDRRSGIDNADDWVKSGKWVLVKSSNVRAIRYDRPSQRLWVRFLRGKHREYHYNGIPTKTAKLMFYAASVGKFVWRIRRAGFIGIPT